MTRNEPIRVAVAGLGGFAGSHHAALEALEAEGRCRVVATCDPALDRMASEIEKYRLVERGVRVFPDLETMLATEPDVVTLPTPIPLHAEQHAAVVRAGAACYLEKPPTLWWPEYRQMLEAERDASRATQVGFNFVGDPFRLALKARIDAGEFGPLQEATFLGLWPRDRAYYTRNDWAGRLYANGRPVMDSPIGNAMAHYVQNLLFWSEGDLKEVRSWLARAHPIESYDTAFVEANTALGATLRIGATHTGTETFDQETLVFRDATLTFESWRRARIETSDGRVETLESSHVDQGSLLRENLAGYFAYVRGERERPITSLAQSERFVALCALASMGDIEAVEATFDEEGRATVEHLEHRLRPFVEHGQWPVSEPKSVRAADLS